MHGLSAKESQHGFNFSNSLIGYREVVLTEDCEIGVLAFSERSDLTIIEGEPCSALCV